MWETLLLYALAEFVLSMTPGPSVFLVIAHSMQHGFQRGVILAGGVMAANTVFFVLSAIGVGALLAAMPNLFFALKLAGAAYLVYVAMQTLYALLYGADDASGFNPNHSRIKPAVTQSFMLGFITNLTNIKTIVIFVSIIPQFLHADQAMLPQFIGLGVVSTMVETPILIVYAYFSVRFTALIKQGGGHVYLDLASAFVLIAIAGSLALT